jgi:hypothetical protein
VGEQNKRNVGDPIAEILATSGLISMLGAVLAAVIAVVALSDGSTAMGGILGAIALLSFVASVLCFAADSRRFDEIPLPFPSLLRPETAAEPSALPRAVRPQRRTLQLGGFPQ